MSQYKTTNYGNASSMATTLRWDPSEMMAIQVQPRLQGQMSALLDQHSIPYQWRGDVIVTYQSAGPLIDQVVGPQPGLASLDLLRRQVGHRSRVTDTIGFVLALTAVAVVVTQSSRVGSAAGAIGIDPDTAHGVTILVAGAVGTWLISTMIIGPRDPRRWLFVLGMIGLFVAAAAWYVAHGMGVL